VSSALFFASVKHNRSAYSRLIMLHSVLFHFTCCIRCIGQVQQLRLLDRSSYVMCILCISVLTKIFPFLQRAQCSHCKRCISYGNSLRPSVRLSVRLSHAGIVSKRRHV